MYESDFTGNFIDEEIGKISGLSSTIGDLEPKVNELEKIELVKGTGISIQKEEGKYKWTISANTDFILILPQLPALGVSNVLYILVSQREGIDEKTLTLHTWDDSTESYIDLGDFGVANLIGKIEELSQRMDAQDSRYLGIPYPSIDDVPSTGLNDNLVLIPQDPNRSGSGPLYAYIKHPGPGLYLPIESLIATTLKSRLDNFLELNQTAEVAVRALKNSINEIDRKYSLNTNIYFAFSNTEIIARNYLNEFSEGDIIFQCSQNIISNPTIAPGLSVATGGKQGLTLTLEEAVKLYNYYKEAKRNNGTNIGRFYFTAGSLIPSGDRVLTIYTHTNDDNIINIIPNWNYSLKINFQGDFSEGDYNAVITGGTLTLNNFVSLTDLTEEECNFLEDIPETKRNYWFKIVTPKDVTHLYTISKQKTKDNTAKDGYITKLVPIDVFDKTHLDYAYNTALELEDTCSSLITSIEYLDNRITEQSSSITGISNRVSTIELDLGEQGWVKDDIADINERADTISNKLDNLSHIVQSDHEDELTALEDLANKRKWKLRVFTDELKELILDESLDPYILENPDLYKRWKINWLVANKNDQNVVTSTTMGTFLVEKEDLLEILYSDDVDSLVPRRAEPDTLNGMRTIYQYASVSAPGASNISVRLTVEFCIYTDNPGGLYVKNIIQKYNYSTNLWEDMDNYFLYTQEA